MGMSDARVRLAAIAAGPDDRIDVAEAALLIAQEEYPQIDIKHYLHSLDRLADGARGLVRPEMAPHEQIAHLNHYLFVKHGFAGNEEAYYDARNSFLNEVLERRTGIPITLGLVYCEVAQRLDLPIFGISFPGHFLAKYVGEPEIIIDPFFGRIISQAECAERLVEVYGRKTRFDRRLLRPARPREILVRMLRNLKQIYVDSSDFSVRCPA